MSTMTTITTPADLATLAQQMLDQLERTGMAERHIKLEGIAFQIILRPAPNNRLQLITAGYACQFPAVWRVPLCAAFGVPEGTGPRFDLRRGYQVVKWTWDRARPEQLSFIEPQEVRGKSNYEEDF